MVYKTYWAVTLHTGQNASVRSQRLQQQHQAGVMPSMMGGGRGSHKHSHTECSGSRSGESRAHTQRPAHTPTAPVKSQCTLPCGRAGRGQQRHTVVLVMGPKQMQQSYSCSAWKCSTPPFNRLDTDTDTDTGADACVDGDTDADADADADATGPLLRWRRCGQRLPQAATLAPCCC